MERNLLAVEVPSAMDTAAASTTELKRLMVRTLSLRSSECAVMQHFALEYEILSRADACRRELV